jgi:hypothetical protein
MPSPWIKKEKENKTKVVIKGFSFKQVTWEADVDPPIHNLTADILLNV